MLAVFWNKYAMALMSYVCCIYTQQTYRQSRLRPSPQASHLYFVSLAAAVWTAGNSVTHSSSDAQQQQWFQFRRPGFNGIVLHWTGH